MAQPCVEDDELDYVDADGEAVRRYVVLRQHVTETVYLTVMHIIAMRLNPTFAARNWRWGKDFAQDCVFEAEVQAENSLGDAERRDYGGVLGVYAKDTATAAAQRFLRESKISSWWRHPLGEERSEDELYAKAREIATATTLDMFTSMLNPKYRGAGFVWSEFVPLVQRWTKLHVKADLSEAEHLACGRAVLTHAAKKAKDLAEKLLADSGVMLWWNDAAQREQAKKGGENA